jgi:hypothetical protein
MQPKMAGADALREVTIDQGSLLPILAQSKPDGLEPTGPILNDANAATSGRASTVDPMMMISLSLNYLQVR